MTASSALIDGSAVGRAGLSVGAPASGALQPGRPPQAGAPTCGTSVARAICRLIGLLCTALVAHSALSTQYSTLVFAEPSGYVPTEVFTSGLVNPRGLAFGPDGSLYVAEAGSGGPQLVELGREKPHAVGRSGRLSRISPSGERTTLVDNLPSIVTVANEEVGPTGLAFLGDQLYLLTASGGWEIGDPEFHNAVFRVDLSGHIERIFDYSAYTLEHPTRSRLQDPRADVPLGMPYGLTALNGLLYSTDGNQEQILAITPTGEATRIVEYPMSNRALTGITAGPDGALYVAEYAARKVSRVTTDGQITDAATAFRTPPIAAAFDRDGRLYTLEYYVGRVARFASIGQPQSEVVAEGLSEATAMAFGPDGNLYVSMGGGKTKGGAIPNRDGQIMRLRLGPVPVKPAAPLSVPALPIVGGLALLALAAGAILVARQRARRGSAT